MGRHLPGVVGYKKIIEYPAQEVRPARGPGSRVRPYYTVNDRLGLTTSALAPAVEVEDVRVRATGRGDRLRFAFRLTDPLPEGVGAAVEVVRGADAGQRYPLTAEGRLLTGEPPLPTRSGRAGTGALRVSWQVRLLVGPAGSLSRISAGNVPGRTARRWNHGPYMRSVTTAPLANGDLKVTVADVHIWSAVNRRLR